MDRISQNQHSFSFFHDTVAFVVTVGIAVFLLTAACSLAPCAAPTAEADPPAALLAPVVPSPPLALLLLPPPQAAPAVSVESDPDLDDEGMPFHGLIIEAAGRYEVDPHLIRAIILAESGYNPRAKSKKGARGLMQLMPSTAKALGVEDIYDPEENIDGGVRYFRSLLDRFDGDIRLALAAYNAGSRYVRHYAGVPPFEATRRYIKKVLRFQKKFAKETAGGSRGVA
jgi:soluble lytic murein transglycosylase-like protein